MTRDAVRAMLLMLESTYSQKGFSVSDKDKSMQTAIINTWTDALADINDDLAYTAVTSWIATEPWPPTPSDIRSRAIPDNAPSALDAWAEVTRAISKYGYTNESDALASMSERTARVVRAIGYRNLCVSENVMADRAHFVKLYDADSARKRQQELIPTAVAEKIATLSAGMSLLGGGSNES